MGMKYWYVVFAIHAIITAITFIAVYCLSSGGINLTQVLSKLPLDDEYTYKINNARMGHIALAVLFVKLLTPVRFAVTLTSSSALLKYLQKNGIVA